MKRIVSVLVLGLTLAIGASAQSLQTAYFLDNYVYSYRFNPASRPDNTKGFFGLAIDNLSVGLNSNVGLNSVLFPKTIDGKPALVTGLNKAVSSEEFLNGIGKSLLINGDANINALSFGFGSKKSFFTFEANVRADVGLNFPKDFLALLKNGTEVPGTYTMGEVSANAAVFAEVVAGYSREITDRFSVGGRIKILAGGGELAMNISGLKAEVTDQITTEGKGSVTAHVLNQNIPMNADGEWDTSNLKFNGLSSLSYGAALDLGVEFKALQNLVISGSVNDLGAINWKNRQEAATSVDKIGGEDMFDLKSTGQSDLIGIGTRINAGIRYDVFNLVSVGLLGTVRTGRFGWAEARAGATFSPGKVFSIAASAGINTYGTCFGAAMSLKIPFIDFHLGIDSIPTKFTPQYIPIDKLHTRVNLGLAIAF